MEIGRKTSCISSEGAIEGAARAKGETGGGQRAGRGQGTTLDVGNQRPLATDRTTPRPTARGPCNEYTGMHQKKSAAIGNPRSRSTSTAPPLPLPAAASGSRQCRLPSAVGSFLFLGCGCALALVVIGDVGGLLWPLASRTCSVFRVP
jgi:hypothetical protein